MHAVEGGYHNQEFEVRIVDGLVYRVAESRPRLSFAIGFFGKVSSCRFVTKFMGYLIDQLTLVGKLKSRRSVPATITAKITDYFTHALPFENPQIL